MQTKLLTKFTKKIAVVFGAIIFSVWIYAVTADFIGPGVKWSTDSDRPLGTTVNLLAGVNADQIEISNDCTNSTAKICLDSDNNYKVDSSNIVANASGSVIERLEWIAANKVTDKNCQVGNLTGTDYPSITYIYPYIITGNTGSGSGIEAISNGQKNYTAQIECTQTVTSITTSSENYTISCDSGYHQDGDTCIVDGDCMFTSGDIKPVTCSFTDLVDQELGTMVESETLVMQGLSGPQSVIISGDGSPEFRIDGGAWITSGNIDSEQTLQLRVTSDSASDTLRTVSFSIGSNNDNWSITTKAQANPTNLSLSHTANNKTLTVSWTAGIENGNCKLQYDKSGVWTDISATTYDCDSDLSSQSVTLPGDGWYSGNWNGVNVRVVKENDSNVMGTFSNTLSCSSTSGSSSSTPNIDEDCDGSWNETGTWYNYTYIPSNSGTTWGWCALTNIWGSVYSKFSHNCTNRADIVCDTNWCRNGYLADGTSPSSCTWGFYNYTSPNSRFMCSPITTYN